MSYLKLTIEPIPMDSLLASLAKLLPSEQWNSIRHEVYRRAGFRCQICGQEDRLSCHEIWLYNEETGCQWLRGFAALCKNCHGVKHLVFCRDAARLRQLINHFVAVNHISQEEAEQYLQTATQQQQRLNQRHWTINYGNYNCYMPALASKQQRRDYAGFLRPQYQPHPQPESSADFFAAEPMTD